MLIYPVYNIIKYMNIRDAVWLGTGHAHVSVNGVPFPTLCCDLCVCYQRAAKTHIYQYNFIANYVWNESRSEAIWLANLLILCIGFRPK